MREDAGTDGIPDECTICLSYFSSNSCPDGIPVKCTHNHASVFQW